MRRAAVVPPGLFVEHLVCIIIPEHVLPEERAASRIWAMSPIIFP
jgi:hypothetical protein